MRSLSHESFQMKRELTQLLETKKKIHRQRSASVVGTSPTAADKRAYFLDGQRRASEAVTAWCAKIDAQNQKVRNLLVHFQFPFPFLTKAVADPRGGTPGEAPPTNQNFLNFMQYLGKSGKFVCWRPLKGLVPLPTGNPVSAPARNNIHYKPLIKSKIQK